MIFIICKSTEQMLMNAKLEYMSAKEALHVPILPALTFVNAVKGTHSMARLAKVIRWLYMF